MVVCFMGAGIKALACLSRSFVKRLTSESGALVRIKNLPTSNTII